MWYHFIWQASLSHPDDMLLSICRWQSTKALPLCLHSTLMVVYQCGLGLYNLDVYKTYPPFQAKNFRLKNLVTVRRALPHGSWLGSNSLHKEILCCPHHKVAIFNTIDEYLRVNFVIVGVGFVLVNVTKFILFESFPCQHPQRLLRAYRHMDFLYHTLCPQYLQPTH